MGCVQRKKLIEESEAPHPFCFVGTGHVPVNRNLIEIVMPHSFMVVIRQGCWKSFIAVTFQRILLSIKSLKGHILL